MTKTAVNERAESRADSRVESYGIASLTYGERLLTPMDAGIVAYATASARDGRMMLRDARRVFGSHRVAEGYAGVARLTTPASAQPKLRKSVTPTVGLTLIPTTGVGLVGGRPVNLCPRATDCALVCLRDTGKGGMPSVTRARVSRSRFMLENPYAAGVILAAELLREVRANGGRILARLNVLSDIRWEYVIPNGMRILASYGVRFYDYTKYAPSARTPIDGVYSLTYSASERMSDDAIVGLLRDGHTVAVVFAASKPAVHSAVAAGMTWHGFALTDGIATDDRTGDAPGTVVALAALGSARRDASGFVRTFTVS